MINPKKHIAPIALITILCAPALIFHYLHVRQKIVQHEMMEKLEHAELQKITLHNQAVHWYKKDKEIVVNSTLFDVHSYSIKKDSTVFRGLFDTQETELKNHVKKLMEQKDEKSSSRDHVIAKLMLQLWITDDNNKDLKLLTPLSIDRRYIIFSDNLLSPDISIPFPPPKV